MATDLTQAISFSLAPGLALSSGIFFYNGLQVRFGRISSLVRELNREARALPPGPPSEPRLASVRLQVTYLEERSLLLHRALVASYAGLIALCMTTLLLLALAFTGVDSWLPGLALATFGGGLALQVVSMVVSSRELVLARNTLVEDVRSTFETPRGQA